MSFKSCSSIILFLSLLSADIVPATEECSPLKFYPVITNLQLLTSSSDNLLLTIQESGAEDADIFCVIYDVATGKFTSHDVECVSYSNDIYEASSSDSDPAATRINSVTETLGIDITRNGHSFVIPWSALPDFDGTSAVNIDENEIESFTLNTVDHFVTLFRVNTDDLYAISYASSTSNEYEIYHLYENPNVDTALESSLAYDVNVYKAHQLVMFRDTQEECAPFVLCEYEISIEEEDVVTHIDKQFWLNFTAVETDYNIIFDNRSQFAYFWGYSSSINMFDIEEDSMILDMYDISERSKDNAPTPSIQKLIYFALCAAYYYLY